MPKKISFKGPSMYEWTFRTKNLKSKLTPLSRRQAERHKGECVVMGNCTGTNHNIVYALFFVSCRSVALFWQLCFSSFVLCTIAVSGKSDWQRCSGKEINQQGPRWAIQDGTGLRNAYLTAACLSEEHGIWTLNKNLFGHQGVQMYYSAFAFV